MSTDQRFTDKRYLRTAAYGDEKRLADRAAIYRHLSIDSIDLGPFPFRAETIVGVASTWLDPSLIGAALDVGCGRGNYLPLLASQCENVVGVDLSEGMLASVPVGAWTLLVGDVEALAFPDDSFDVVFANHIIYHAPDIGAAVHELRRVLRPGGVLITATNGDGNFRRTFELIAEAASLASGRPCEPVAAADRRFTLESGKVALAQTFGSVEAHRTTGKLVIAADGINDLLAYYRSVDDEWVAAYDLGWPTLERALVDVLNRHIARDGAITISTVSGLLCAT